MTNHTKHWSILLAVMLGNVFVAVNSTVIALALTIIANDLNETLSSTSWIMTIYLMFMAGTLPVSGKLGERFGSKFIYVTGLILFLASSVASAFATSLDVLIVLRIFQAIGGAFVVPNAAAILRFVMPKKQLGKAFGILSSGAGIGSALGPFLGSLLIGTFGWQSVFFIGAPFTLLSIILTILLVPKMPNNKEVKYNGIFDASLFKNKGFVASNISIFTNNLYTYGLILALPLVFSEKLHLSIENSGYILTSFYVANAIFSVIGGILSDRVGTKATIFSSYLLATTVTIGFFFLNAGTSVNLLFIMLIIAGIAIGISFSSSQIANVQSLPKEKTASGNGTYQTFRFLGSVVASIVVSHTGGSTIFFIFLFIMCLVGIGASTGIKSKENKSNFFIKAKKTAV